MPFLSPKPPTDHLHKHTGISSFCIVSQAAASKPLPFSLSKQATIIHHAYPSDLTSTHSLLLLLTPTGRPKTLASSAAERSSSMRRTSGSSSRQPPGSALIRAALCVLLASSTAGMPYVHPCLLAALDLDPMCDLVLLGQ